MRKGAGKSKGSNFEREICKRLSLWVSNGKNPDLFWRSAMSGGRATVNKKKGADIAHVAGDICAVHVAGHVLTDNMFIECKHYKDLGFMSLLVNRAGITVQFWNKLVQQAADHGKPALLIMRQNSTKIMVLADAKLAARFLDAGAEATAYIYYMRATLFELDAILACPFPFRKRVIL